MDSRIRTLVENCVKLGQRSLFVIVGDKGRDQVHLRGLLLLSAQLPLSGAASTVHCVLTTLLPGTTCTCCYLSCSCCFAHPPSAPRLPSTPHLNIGFSSAVAACPARWSTFTTC